MLKLSVYFMKNSYIVLDPEFISDKNYFVIRLEPAITETMKLFSTETFTKPGYNGWIKCNCNDEPDLDFNENWTSFVLHHLHYS